MSSHDDVPVIVDTVILLYFALVDQLPLLVELAPHGLYTTSVVFDPDEPTPKPPGVDEDTLCEIGRAQHFYTRESSDPRSRIDEQQRAQVAVTRLSSVATRYGAGDLNVTDLTEPELSTFAMLVSPEASQAHGLRRAIHAGEAACLAVAVERGWTLGTDDSDALHALEMLSPNHRYERIRKLLVRAAHQGLITEATANDIHSLMRTWEFWDTTEPFPG